jgi:cell shape-determining protein MreC
MDSISQTLLEPIFNSVQAWLATHPVIAWIMSHPLWAIALFFIALLLSWGLLGAIARLIQQAWFLILRAPLKLLQWIFNNLFKAFPRRSLNAEEPTVLEQREQRLLETLNRLEALQQEQEELMQEVKAILMLKS